MMDRERDGLRELTETECRERLARDTVRIGRIAFLEAGYPVVLPVNYRLLDGQFVFRSGIGSKLDAVLSGMPVAFEVDAVDPAWEEGWSVLVKGKAEEIVGAERLRAEKLGLRPWAEGNRSRYIVIRAEHTTGRQIA